MLSRIASTDKSEDGRKVLIKAACKGHTEVVKLLLSAGADINYADARTALMRAARDGHTYVVNLFLPAGDDIN